MPRTRHGREVRKTGEREVTFTFDQPGNRELPTIVGELTVLPKHWWEGTTAKPASAISPRPRWRSRSAPSLPDQGFFVAARSVSVERVKDIGAQTCRCGSAPTISTSLRFEFFRDNLVALEAFKADQADWIAENSAKQWATAYDFPAIQEKRVVREEFPIKIPAGCRALPSTCAAICSRMRGFAAPSNYAYDFEEMNKQLFYGQYKRINSYFEGTELASSGLPQGDELQILETVRDKVPAEVFTTAYANPVGGNPEAVRSNLRESAKLLKEAGFEVRERKLVDAAGKPVTVEILRAGSVLRANRTVLQTVAGTHRRDSLDPVPWTTRNIRTGCAASIST